MMRLICFYHLAGVTDPEQKRKIIGKPIEVFDEEAAKWQMPGSGSGYVISG